MIWPYEKILYLISFVIYCNLKLIGPECWKPKYHILFQFSNKIIFSQTEPKGTISSQCISIKKVNILSIISIYTYGNYSKASRYKVALVMGTLALILTVLSIRWVDAFLWTIAVIESFWTLLNNSCLGTFLKKLVILANLIKGNFYAFFCSKVSNDWHGKYYSNKLNDSS